MHSIVSSTLGFALAAGFAGSASAATLIDFRFDTGGNIDESSFYTGGSTSTATNVSTPGLISGAGVTPLNSVDRYEVNNLNDTGDQGTLTEALAQAEFTGFTASADAGFELDLAGGSVVFNDFEKTGAGTRAPDRATLFSSVDGFTLASQGLATSTAFSSFGAQDLIFNLPSDARFDDLSSVEFRVYFYRSTPPTTLGGGYRSALLTGNDPFVRLNGEVTAVAPIPEPASVALVGLGSLLILGRRRTADA